LKAALDIGKIHFLIKIQRTGNFAYLVCMWNLVCLIKGEWDCRVFENRGCGGEYFNQRERK
jgi:hypothetical protein